MTSARLGGFALADVAARIEAFARTYRKAGRARRYVLSDGMLVREDRFLSSPGRFMRALGKGAVHKIELPLTAQAILANWNLRVMGLGDDGQLTAQIRMRGSKGQLFREVTARRSFTRHLAGDSEIAIPALRAYDRANGLWLVEDYVRGRPGELADLAAFLAGPAVRLHRRTARPRPLAAALSQSRGLLAELAADVPALGRLMALSPEAVWPVALCHGDVMVGNILRTPDRRFWLVDWERACAQPVAVDLASTVMWQPPMQEAALSILRQFDPQRTGPAAESLLALGVVLLFRRLAINATGGSPPAPRLADWRQGHLLGLMRSLLT